MAVSVLLGGFDADVGGGEPALAHLLDLQPNGQPQRVETTAHRLDIDTGIEEGGEGHIAADAAETVEVQNTHADASFGVRFYRAADEKTGATARAEPGAVAPFFPLSSTLLSPRSSNAAGAQSRYRAGTAPPALPPRRSAGPRPATSGCSRSPSSMLPCRAERRPRGRPALRHGGCIPSDA